MTITTYASLLILTALLILWPTINVALKSSSSKFYVGFFLKVALAAITVIVLAIAFDTLFLDTLYCVDGGGEGKITTLQKIGDAGFPTLSGELSLHSKDITTVIKHIITTPAVITMFNSVLLFSALPLTLLPILGLLVNCLLGNPALLMESSNDVAMIKIASLDTIATLILRESHLLVGLLLFCTSLLLFAFASISIR